MTIRKKLGAMRREYWRKQQEKCFETFHFHYYTTKGKHTWEDTHFFGVRVLKCPFDLWTYQEIIYRTKPDLIIETGTFNGGSTFYYAHLLDLMGHGQVVSVDIDPQPDLPSHPRIRYIKDSSIGESVLGELRAMAAGCERVMVVLDSDHSCEHVYKEMVAYAPLVSPGCYMVVEDGNINGRPNLPQFGPGPAEAIERFLSHDESFEVDKRCERHLFSFNPGGWLLKK